LARPSGRMEGKRGGGGVGGLFSEIALAEWADHAKKHYVLVYCGGRHTPPASTSHCGGGRLFRRRGVSSPFCRKLLSPLCPEGEWPLCCRKNSSSCRKVAPSNNPSEGEEIWISTGGKSATGRWSMAHQLLLLVRGKRGRPSTSKGEKREHRLAHAATDQKSQQHNLVLVKIEKGKKISPYSGEGGRPPGGGHATAQISLFYQKEKTGGEVCSSWPPGKESPLRIHGGGGRPMSHSERPGPRPKPSFSFPKRKVTPLRPAKEIADPHHGKSGSPGQGHCGAQRYPTRLICVSPPKKTARRCKTSGWPTTTSQEGLPKKQPRNRALRPPSKDSFQKKKKRKKKKKKKKTPGRDHGDPRSFGGKTRLRRIPRKLEP